MSFATDKPATCQGSERLSRLELTVKRLHLAVWVTLIVLIIFLVFIFGKRTQFRNSMMQGRANQAGEMGYSNPPRTNGMPGSMRGMNGNPNDNQQDIDRDYDKPKKRMKNDGGPNQRGDQPPQSPAPPSGNQ